MDDEMKIKSSFMKSLISSAVSKILRSKGIEIDISILEFELHRDDDTKRLKASVKADVECTDDQLSKLIV